jgi:hypothetical protein
MVEQGMTAREAQEMDAEGKGGGLVDGELVREFPDRKLNWAFTQTAIERCVFQPSGWSSVAPRSCK